MRARADSCACSSARASASSASSAAASARGASRVETRLERALAHHRLAGQAHAVGRQDAGQRMGEDARHSQRVGDQAGVLAAGAAEDRERVRSDVVAARHRDALHRVGHVRHRDLDEAGGDLLGRAPLAGRGGDVGRQRGEPGARRLDVERLAPVRAEDAREVIRLELAEHDVAVGDRQRPAAPVAGRPRVGAGRLGADAKARAVEAHDRSPARRDGVDRQHRRAHAHAGDLGIEGALEIGDARAREVRDVGRRAAHVEADHAGRTRRAGWSRTMPTMPPAGPDRIASLP